VLYVLVLVPILMPCPSEQTYDSVESALARDVDTRAASSEHPDAVEYDRAVHVLGWVRLGRGAESILRCAGRTQRGEKRRKRNISETKKRKKCRGLHNIKIMHNRFPLGTKEDQFSRRAAHEGG
jgi:hypothetical protein